MSSSSAWLTTNTRWVAWGVSVERSLSNLRLYRASFSRSLVRSQEGVSKQCVERLEQQSIKESKTIDFKPGMNLMWYVN